MMFKVILLAAIMGLALAEPVPEPSTRCDKLHPNSGLTGRYWESIAHAIHSMDLQALRKFSSKALVDNHIPTVNLNLQAANKVLENAPSLPLGHDFATEEMNEIDRILALIGKSDDGLGAHWTPLERVVHHFHMHDLWAKIKPAFDKVAVDAAACSCLLETEKSGVKDAVAWVANHYKTGTPITLLNRKIAKLTDAKTWTQWKDRLLHYYNPNAVRDAAYYLKCAL